MHKEISEIFTRAAQADRFTEICCALLGAQVRFGVLPCDEAEGDRAVREIMLSNPEWMEQQWANREAEIRHDVKAWIQTIREATGFEYWAWGLTSSDLVDTADSMAVRKVYGVLQEAMGELDTGWTRMMIRSVFHVEPVEGETYSLTDQDKWVWAYTHGQAAMPMDLDHWLGVQHLEISSARTAMQNSAMANSVIRLRGPIGNINQTGGVLTPEIEHTVGTLLGLTHAPASTQVIPRSHRQTWYNTLAGVAGLLESLALRYRLYSLMGLAAAPGANSGSSAMPHKDGLNPHLLERVCGLAPMVRAIAHGSAENVALWLERDLTHSATDRISMEMIPHLLLEQIHCLTQWFNHAEIEVFNGDTRPESSYEINLRR